MAGDCRHASDERQRAELVGDATLATTERFQGGLTNRKLSVAGCRPMHWQYEGYISAEKLLGITLM